MAGLCEFPNKVSSIHAVCWSPDNRIAVCTDNVMKILTLNCSVDNTESKLRCKQSSFPVNPEIFNIPEFTVAEHKFLLQNLPRDEIKVIATERVLNPYKYLYDTMDYTAYAQCEWSPLGADDVGRSVLAALSQDYRLCVYSMGSSQCDWMQACDLSTVRRNQTKPDFNLQSLDDYYSYKDWCLSQAVSCVKWYPDSFGSDKDQIYTILATGTKTGHIVTWKISLPCHNASDCFLLQEVQPHQSQVSGLEWDKDSGTLIVGYQDGQMQLLQFNLEDFSAKPKTLDLHTDSDLMKAKCICILNCKQDSTRVVLVNKEHVLLAFHVSTEQLAVITQTHLFLENTQPASGLCRLSDTSALMMSHDMMLLQFTVSFGPNGLSVTKERKPLDLPPDTTWVCHGFCLSPNSILAAFMVRPRPGFDHLAPKWRRSATKIHLKCVDDIHVGTTYRNKCMTLLMDSKDSTSRLLDVFEVYRQCIVSGQCSMDVIQTASIPAQSRIRYLQLLRFKLMVDRNSLPAKKDSKDDVARLEKQISDITAEVLLLYVKQAIEKDHSAVHCLYPWIQNQTFASTQSSGTSNESSHDQDNQPETSLSGSQESNPETSQPCDSDTIRQSDIQNTSLCAILKEIKTYMKTISAQDLDSTLRCCICSQTMRATSSSWTCTKGHVFDLCCKTLQPIEDVDYTTCSVCSHNAKPPQSLKDLGWLQGNLNRCTLCDGLLISVD